MFADICPDRQAVVLTVWRQALCGVDAGVGAPWADIDMPHAEDPLHQHARQSRGSLGDFDP